MTTIVITTDHIVTDTKQITGDANVIDIIVEYGPKFIVSNDNKYIVTSSGNFNYDLDPLHMDQLTSKIELAISTILNYNKLVDTLSVKTVDEHLLYLQADILKLFSIMPGTDNRYDTLNFLSILTSDYVYTIGSLDLRALSTTNLFSTRSRPNSVNKDWVYKGESLISDGFEERFVGKNKPNIPSELLSCRSSVIMSRDIIRFITVGTGGRYASVALRYNGLDPVDAVKYSCSADTLSGYNSKGIAKFKYDELKPMKLLTLDKLVNLIGE